MTFGEFRDEVFSPFLSRSEPELTTARRNAIINMAKLRLQMEYGLKMAMRIANLTYPNALNTGADMPADFKEFPYDRSVTLTGVSGVSGSRLPISGTNHARSQGRLAAQSGYLQSETSSPAASSVLAAASQGLHYYILPLAGSGTSPTGVSTWKFFLTPELLASTVEIIYIAWLPDYANNADTDFLLTVGRVTLLWESLRVANMFEDEDNRVEINERAFQDSLAGLASYCTKAIRSGSHIDVT
jgi:hypothetical protein